MKLDKIYTKTGDQGKTSLITGERVEKGGDRVDTFGTVDELNSVIGLMRTWALQSESALVRAESEVTLQQIQNDLFDMGAILACTPARAGDVLPLFPAEAALRLEQRMDYFHESLGTLNSFVLPGGNMLNAYAHLARTVCRRTERLAWRLHRQEPVPESVLIYLNRLSDYLFVLSRWVLHVEGLREFLWRSSKRASPDAG